MKRQSDNYTREDFEVIHYIRTGFYVVKTKKLHTYLRLNKITGGVSIVQNIDKATTFSDVDDCKVLIEWFFEPSPIEVY